MVWQDLSQNFSEEKAGAYKVAPPQDRLLAIFFDFVFVTPFLAIILSPFYKKIELLHYTAIQSKEFAIILGITAFLIFLTIIFYQSLMNYWLGYTPGKYICKLRVRSIEGEKIGLTQSFLRSFIWALSVIFFAVPFLEVFSHRFRRTIYDRASGTMVVTMKLQADRGPHFIETQFVRNLMATIFGTAFLLLTMLSFEVYQMASRGEFTVRSEVGKDLRCEQIDRFIQAKDQRLDLAIAMYLAQEVDDDCLMNEADLVLWTDTTSNRAWGYLAKAVFYNFDKEKSDEYLHKACEVGPAHEACILAVELTAKENTAALLDEVNVNEMSVNEDGYIHLSKTSKSQISSYTAEILHIRKLNRSGKFDQVYQSLQALSQTTEAFQSYVQIEKAKMLTALHRYEEAQGAYENTWNFMAPEQRQKFSAWMCLEDTDRQCENRNYQACNYLRQEIENQVDPDISAEAVVALVEEAECKKSKKLNMLTFHYALESDDALKKYVMALSSDSHLNAEARKKFYADIAFGKELSASHFLRRRAMYTLVQNAHSENDLQNVVEYVQATHIHDWTWQKLNNKLSTNVYAQNLMNKSKGPQIRLPASNIENTKTKSEEK